ncbi:MAG: 4Fe-4S single cluster domain-containing protein [Candidatus Heimdallarchaeaceae archaeon]
MKQTRANGPGVRLGIWVQGCTRNCPGCINPETHDPNKGVEMSVEEILSTILECESEIEGISISGGEPLDQIEELQKLLELLKNQTKLTVILWTGYKMEELDQMRFVESFLGLIDLAIIGPYETKYHEPIGLKGSSNQEYLFFSSKYTEQNMFEVPSAEIIFFEGEMQISGINTEQIRNWFR